MKDHRWFIPTVSLFIGLLAALLLSVAVGENPFAVIAILAKGAFGDPTQLGYTLYYATPLIFTGLSVAWAFRSGLFNIGAEGQMTLGGVTMAIIGASLKSSPAFIAVPLSLFSGFLVGGIWGAIAGWIKVKRGCHEVLATILMNFIAYGISGFLILSVFRNPNSQNPETAEIGPGFHLPMISWLGGQSPLNIALLFGFVAVIIYAIVFKKSLLGFHFKMTGSAPGVARRAGISIDRHVIMAMFFSGGLAALAAASPILGYSFKAREGFTSGAGFVGIAVALLGRNSPIGVLLAALLFGALTKGSLNLDLDSEKLTRDLAVIIQALIVLSVACQPGWEKLWRHLRSLAGRTR